MAEVTATKMPAAGPNREACFNDPVRFGARSCTRRGPDVRTRRGDHSHLGAPITLRPADLHPGSGTLTRLFNDPGVSLSVHNLLELMLLIPDNSATDPVLKAAGGGLAVNARLAAIRFARRRLDHRERPLVVTGSRAARHYWPAHTRSSARGARGGE